MPTITASGLGSGLDVNSLVGQLLAAERAPHDNRLAARETKATTQISALGSLRGALGAFKTALEPLKTESAFLARKVVSGDEDLFTATVGTTAAGGTYGVDVRALAKAHQLASGAIVGGAAAVVGTGTLTIESGTNTFSLTFDSTNNTLDGVRDAINAATDNTSVQATLVHETGGSHLVITARNTGAANAIGVSTTGGDGGLTQFVYDAGGVQNLDEKQVAQDAHVRIAGFDHFSATNTITGAIDDVTLTLKAADPDNIVSLDVAFDAAQVGANIRKFVTEYNSLYAQFKKLRAYNAETRVGGPLLGDSMLNSIEEQVRRGLSDPVSSLTGTYTSLASIGVTRQADGTLAVNDTKLNTALGTDQNAVAQIFGSTSGVAARLHSMIDSHLSSSGDVTARDSSLQASVKVIKKDREALELRMVSVQQRLFRQFSALDSLLSRMQSTSNYLASQLSSLPTPGG